LGNLIPSPQCNLRPLLPKEHGSLSTWFSLKKNWMKKIQENARTLDLWVAKGILTIAVIAIL
jgi:hypothetical protein